MVSCMYCWRTSREIQVQVKRIIMELVDVFLEAMLKYIRLNLLVNVCVEKRKVAKLRQEGGQGDVYT
jgi:hypothetical protein